MVAHEQRTGRTIRVWADELAAMPAPPFSTGPDALLVAYYASAEMGCYLALGWSPPARLLDLYAEFRCLTNGRDVPCGNGLLGALSAFGLDGIDAAEDFGGALMACGHAPPKLGEEVMLLGLGLSGHIAHSSSP